MPLQWLTEKPIWTKQRPLAEEKLLALEQLVQEQLDAVTFPQLKATV